DDDDDDDETKKTKKTKKTEESTEAPTEAPTTTESTTEATTTPKETTTKQTTSSAASDTSSSHAPLNPNQPTQNYKKISSGDFKSKAESMGWYILEDEPEDLEDDVTECIYAYDEEADVVIIYTHYKNTDAAAEMFEEYLDEVETEREYGDLVDSVVVDNTILVLTEDEYVVIIMLDDVEIYSYTDCNDASIQKANQALQSFGYTIE
ncbi:MAG: hypothetical protein J5636_01165, partial [Clostridiales bacterium]|nr:hypothetical protein [Clostridiales bacterium]